VEDQWDPIIITVTFFLLLRPLPRTDLGNIFSFLTFFLFPAPFSSSGGGGGGKNRGMLYNCCSCRFLVFCQQLFGRIVRAGASSSIDLMKSFFFFLSTCKQKVEK